MNGRDGKISTGNTVNLAALDLNLLVVLDAVLAERSVTRAARRVGLSQPAVSNALARLRGQLHDPLLVRAGGGMRPTPFAEQLEGPLRNLLARLSSLLTPRTDFDPQVATGALTIAASDYVSRILVPPLMARIAAVAPHIDLHVRAHNQVLPEDDLASGTILLALGFFWQVDAPLVSVPVLEDRLACLVPADAPPLTLERYLDTPHVLVSQSGQARGHVDRMLGARGLSRRVRTVVPHFLAVPAVLDAVGGVATLPERLAHSFGTAFRVEPVPLELPSFSVTSVHHKRLAQDGARRWLADQVAAVCDAKSASILDGPAGWGFQRPAASSQPVIPSSRG